MKVMVKIVFFLLLAMVFLTSCAGENLPSEPGAPGETKQTAVAGRAFYAGLGELGYAQPTKFFINKDSLPKGEALLLSVQNEDYIYKYYYISVNGQWLQQTFSGEVVGNSNWIKSSASASLATDQLPEGDNYVVAYSCSLVNAKWDCHGNKWQIHQFEVLSPKPKVECSSDMDCQPNYQCKEGKCAPVPEELKKPDVPFSASCDDDFSNLMASKFLWSLDFEDLDDEGWIRGWMKPRVQAEGTELASFELDTNVKHTGQRALKMSAPGATYSGSIGHNGAIRVTPGEYTISFWVKGTDVVSQTGHMTILQMTSKEALGGALDRSQGKYWFTAYPTQTYEWKQVTQGFTVPPNQDAMDFVIIFQNGAGTVWLDDIVVMPAKQFNALSETTLEAETRTTEMAAPARHYFLRDKPIEAKAVLRNQKGTAGTYTVKAALNYCGKTLQQAQQTISVASYARADVPLMTINPSALEMGDYLLNITLEQNNKIVDSVLHPVGLRLPPQPEFLFSIGFGKDFDPSSAIARMDKYKSHGITPLFYGGEPTAFAADAALSRNMPFTVRLIPPEIAFPKKKRPDGGDFSVYSEGISDDTMWPKAAQPISSAVRRISHFPAFFPRIFTSDDFNIYSGWDWADRNKERFKQLTGLDAPAPKEFTDQVNPSAVESFVQPKGSVSSNEPWLAYNRFLSKEVLGEYNKKVTSAVTQANPNVKIGPIPGGQQWPLFQTNRGQYPPYNFGKNGFNMISYYVYLYYWRPQIAYVYWTDISRMGNKDLPLYVMPDAYVIPEPSYYWNNFYLLLASGVDGMAYFIDSSIPSQQNPPPLSSAAPEFWEIAQKELGPIAEKFGSLFTKLEPAKHPVGLLSSFTSATYSVTNPLRDLCAYSNLLMSHVDVETVSEEEILADGLSQYSAVVLSDMDWLRNDVVSELAKTGTKIILDKNSEVPLSGSQVQKVNFNFVEGNCAANPDYGIPDRLAAMRTELNKIVPPTVVLDKDTVIYRKYSGGTSQYLWLVDVHTRDEYIRLFDFVQQRQGYDKPEVLAEMNKYLQQQGIYSSSTPVNVKVQTVAPVVVVDVLGGKVISSTFENGWTTFQTEIARLKGKLIAFYPVLPTSVQIEAPSSVTRGVSAVLKASILAGGNKLLSPFPIYVELLDPNGKQHPYTRYAATTTQGEYQLPIMIGTNAPKGTWKIRVTELSTGVHNSIGFNLQ